MRSTWARRLAAVSVLGLLPCLAACTSSSSGEPASTGAAASSSSGSALGTYRVSTRTLDLTDPTRITDAQPTEPGGEVPGRHLPTTIWYPSSGKGPFPVVAFSHGVLSTASTYEGLLSGWASAGFIVIGPTFPLTNHDVPTVTADILNQPADVSFVLTQVLALDTKPGDVLEGRIDARHIAAAGHSGGAVTTLGLLNTCCRDPRITAAVVLAGTLAGFGNTFATPGVPTLFEHGTADDAIPIADGQAAYDAAPGRKAFVRLNKGLHSSPYNDKPADALFPAVRSSTTDFLRWALAGDTGALARFRAAANETGLTRLTSDDLGG